jgi:hypothetical protein
LDAFLRKQQWAGAGYGKHSKKLQHAFDVLARLLLYVLYRALLSDRREGEMYLTQPMMGLSRTASGVAVPILIGQLFCLLFALRFFLKPTRVMGGNRLATFCAR